METVTYSLNLLLKLFLWIFIPVLVIVSISAFILFKYKKKNINEEKFQKIMLVYSSLLAILIAGALSAIMIGFSINFTSSLQEKNLVTNNKLIYYFILITPLLPISFLVYYIVKLISIISNKKNQLIKDDDNEVETIKQNIDQEKDIEIL